jgi:hypothetical protein
MNVNGVVITSSPRLHSSAIIAIIIAVVPSQTPTQMLHADELREPLLELGDSPAP